MVRKQYYAVALLGTVIGLSVIALVFSMPRQIPPISESTTSFFTSETSNKSTTNQNASKVVISSIVITRIGSLATYLLAASQQAPNSCTIFHSGDLIQLNFSLVFQTAGDDGVVFTDVSATKVSVSVQNTDFQILRINVSSYIENPIFVPANKLVEFTMTVKAPSQNFEGPLNVVLDAQRA